MNREVFFINIVKELCGKLRIQVPIIRKDNRLQTYVASVNECNCKECKNITLRYNAKKVNHLSKWELTYIALHEIGHIKTDAPTRVEREYKAEKFAHKAIQKYFPKYYRNVLGYTIWVVANQSGVYKRAYDRLLKEKGL